MRLDPRFVDNDLKINKLFEKSWVNKYNLMIGGSQQETIHLGFTAELLF